MKQAYHVAILTAVVNLFTHCTILGFRKAEVVNRPEQLTEGTVLVISESGAQIFDEPDQETKHVDKIMFLSLVKVHPEDIESHVEKEFIRINYRGDTKYVEWNKLAKIQIRRVSPDGQRILLGLVGPSMTGIEYKVRSQFVLFSAGKLRTLPISRSQLERVDWLDNKHIVLSSDSGDGGSGVESTYRINIDDYKEYRIHGSFHSVDETGKCRDTKHCVCSVETFFSGESEYFVESYPNIVFYKIPQGKTIPNRCQRGMDKRTLQKIQVFKHDADSLGDLPSYDRDDRSGLRIKIGNTIFLVNGETDKITIVKTGRK